MDQRTWDERFMREAIKEAQKALDEDQLPVGVVIVADGKIIARVYKPGKCNTRLDHGEMIALREVTDISKAKTKDMCLYTTLEPCTMCFGAILNCKIGRVVYAMEDPNDGCATIYDFKQGTIRHRHEHPEVVAGVLRAIAKDLFKTYFETTNNEFWRAANSNPLKRVCCV